MQSLSNPNESNLSPIQTEQLNSWMDRNDIASAPGQSPDLLHVYEGIAGKAYVSPVELKTARERKVTVIDSIMGSGKSTYIIDTINCTYANQRFGDSPPNFMVVVPYLNEISRFIEACPMADFFEPTFENEHGKKSWDLKRLIADERNIVTTHALFEQLDREAYGLIQERNYVLIIDEAIATVEEYTSVDKDDWPFLFNNNVVSVDPQTKKLIWNYQTHGDYAGAFKHVKARCELGSLVRFQDSYVIAEFPSEFIACFKDVTILTYLFDGSPFSAYLRSEGFEIERKAIYRGKLLDWETEGKEFDRRRREFLAKHIRLYDGPLNAIGGSRDRRAKPLSYNWFRDRVKKEPEKRSKGKKKNGVKKKPRKAQALSADLIQLKSGFFYFFRKFAKVPADENGWTVFEDAEPYLREYPYSNGFISVSTKATNDFAHKTAMAYGVNRYHKPVIKSYFESKGVVVNEDLYALSEMIQWLWRSGIRHDNPPTVFFYIPSDRMRRLFTDWLYHGKLP